MIDNSNIVIDGKVCVINAKLFTKIHGNVKINIDPIELEIIFKEDSTLEKKSPIRFEAVDDKKLRVFCLNYSAVSPMSQGLVSQTEVFTIKGVQHYLQFTSSIFSIETDTRELNVLIVKDQ